MNELGYGDYQFERFQSITIKKTGVNEEYDKDIWEFSIVIIPGCVGRVI